MKTKYFIYLTEVRDDGTLKKECMGDFDSTSVFQCTEFMMKTLLCKWIKAFMPEYTMVNFIKNGKERYTFSVENDKVNVSVCQSEYLVWKHVEETYDYAGL